MSLCVRACQRTALATPRSAQEVLGAEEPAVGAPSGKVRGTSTPSSAPISALPVFSQKWRRETTHMKISLPRAVIGLISLSATSCSSYSDMSSPKKTQIFATKKHTIVYSTTLSRLNVLVRLRIIRRVRANFSKNVFSCLGLGTSFAIDSGYEPSRLRLRTVERTFSKLPQKWSGSMEYQTEGLLRFDLWCFQPKLTHLVHGSRF